MINLSKGRGIGGKIKESAEDFIVREITKEGVVLELDKEYKKESTNGNFAVFVLQKKNWNTQEALLAIAKRFRRGRKSIGYAGLKDRIATTVQLASVYGARSEELEKVMIKDIKINGAWQSEKGIEMGDLLGNAFTARIKGAEKSSELVERKLDELNNTFPNYFDKQRFGLRNNNHIIGMKIIKGDFEGAVMEYLTSTNNEIHELAINARKRLSEEKDFKRALEYFPKYLKYERSVIDYMARYNNYANALRRLPRGLSLIFVHAVEDYIFNIALERRIKENDVELRNDELSCKANFYGFPDIENRVHGREGYWPVFALVGYESRDDEISPYEKEAMEELGIKKEDFKIKSMPELSMKGSYRPCFAPFRDFSYSIGEDVTLNFSLPAGSYATILLNEFINPN
ncbi:MAG: tRNA pseudouridine(13) synthase TruD [Candidatus Micrarchaeia archaeon]